jgi:hypothetical protein
MTKYPKVFLSYAHVDTEFVYANFIPLLRQLTINLWVAGEEIETGQSINEAISKGIQSSDLIICIYNKKSTFVNLEVGMAIGGNKPILVVINDNTLDIPNEIKQLNIIQFSESKLNEFVPLFMDTIRRMTEEVINKNIYTHNELSKIIGINVGFEKSDFEKELRFTLDFIQFIKSITKEPSINLVHSAKGSFKSLISIDLKSWAELVEKFLFFIPELKKKKLERLQIEADIEKTKAETKSINVKSNIEQAEAFVNLLDKYQSLGVKIQIDKNLLITQDENGQLTFSQPKTLDNTTANIGIANSGAGH